MDARTVFLLLAVGSFLFGLLLVAFKFNRQSPQNVPFWIPAKFLQATGSLILYFRAEIFDSLTVLAHAALLLGCSYEAWAVRLLAGQPVKRRQPLVASLAIALACSITIKMVEPHRLGTIFFLQSFFYFLPGFFLARRSDLRSSLRWILAVGYASAASIFLIASFLCLFFPEYAFGLEHSPVSGAIPLTSFCLFLISGYLMLMLAKERSDLQVREIEEDLKKSEIRFQHIVETANEGILIFNKHTQIAFANRKMASLLGYTIDELLGKPYIFFFPENQLGVYSKQEFLRKRGGATVYECRLQRKDGKYRWFLVSAKAMSDEFGRFAGSFAMFTDIDERKKMEILLEESNRRLQELSNTDSLTGIANRRCFDATLEHEYSRLRRSRSKLSVILLDVDHFKAYNDYYGHVKGDECLRQVGRVLASSISRSVDLAARYGGEEFACILPDTDFRGAVKIAEKIRQRIHDLGIEHKKSGVSGVVTASVGVVTVNYSPDRAPSDIIAAADKMLYKAKVSGRNRVEYAEG